MMRSAKRVVPLAALGLLIAAAALVWWVGNSEFVTQDACLDSGGRWLEDEQCQFEQQAE